MRVLVTGSTGFIASHLMPQLVEKGHEVWSMERYVTGRYARTVDVYTIHVDLRDLFLVRKHLREIQPDVIFHLASISPVSYSYEHPIDVIEANFTATVNLAESALRECHHLQHFIFAGTTEEYGVQPEGTAITENTDCYPNSPYAVSKYASTQYLLYMHRAYTFPVTIMRPTNTFGRKRDHHFLIEKTVVNMLQNCSEVKLGDPTPTRQWLFVDDHVQGYLNALEHPDKITGQMYCLFGLKPYTIQDTVQLISKIVGYQGRIQWHSDARRPLDANWLVGSSEKASRELGWAPKVDLEHGLEKTIAHWRTNLHHTPEN